MLNKYRIIFDNKKNVEKTLKKFPKKIKNQIQDAFESLEKDPLPPNCLSCKKLVNYEYYSFEVGNYRIVYIVDNSIKEVKILIIGDRKNIYKELKRKYR